MTRAVMRFLEEGGYYTEYTLRPDPHAPTNVEMWEFIHACNEGWDSLSDQHYEIYSVFNEGEKRRDHTNSTQDTSQGKRQGTLTFDP